MITSIWKQQICFSKKKTLACFYQFYYELYFGENPIKKAMKIEILYFMAFIKPMKFIEENGQLCLSVSFNIYLYYDPLK